MIASAKLESFTPAKMAAHAVRCGECSWTIPSEFWNQQGRCSRCGLTLQTLVFPAIANTARGTAPEVIGDDSEASCFYHSHSRAAVPCEQCGRFLCHLCDLEVEGRHLCPSCFQAGLTHKRLETVETRRTMYDTVALALATIPAVFLWPVLVTAPAALWVVVRRWNAPGSLVSRTRIRFYLAALFALAEIVGAGFLIWAFLRISRP
jgi:hypothetical protein